MREHPQNEGLSHPPNRRYLANQGSSAILLGAHKVRSCTGNPLSNDTVKVMIIDQPHGLHEGITRGRADKAPAALLEGS